MLVATAIALSTDPQAAKVADLRNEVATLQEAAKTKPAEATPKQPRLPIDLAVIARDSSAPPPHEWLDIEGRILGIGLVIPRFPHLDPQGMGVVRRAVQMRLLKLFPSAKVEDSSSPADGEQISLELSENLTVRLTGSWNNLHAMGVSGFWPEKDFNGDAKGEFVKAATEIIRVGTGEDDIEGWPLATWVQVTVGGATNTGTLRRIDVGGVNCELSYGDSGEKSYGRILGVECIVKSKYVPTAIAGR